MNDQQSPGASDLGPAQNAAELNRTVLWYINPPIISPDNVEYTNTKQYAQ